MSLLLTHFANAQETKGLGFGVEGDKSIYFATKLNVSSKPDVLLNPAGQLGIGTEKPEHRLHVVGNIYGTQLLNVQSIRSRGFDFVLGNGNKDDRGDSGLSRALVKWYINEEGSPSHMQSQLMVNFNNDFKGGTRFNGSIQIDQGGIRRGHAPTSNGAPDTHILGLYSYKENAPINFVTNNGRYDFYLQHDNEGRGTSRVLSLSHGNGNRRAGYDGDNNWDFVSDERIKENFEAAEPMLDKIKQIKIQRYHYKKGTHTTGSPKELGVLAQNVEKVFPDLVTESKEIDKDYGFKVKTVGYTTFGVVALKGIQEQQALIEALQQENKKLKAQMAELQGLKAEVTEIKSLLNKQSTRKTTENTTVK